LSSSKEAEDLVQETFFALHTHILEHGFPDNLPGMLRVLMERKLLNHLRDEPDDERLADREIHGQVGATRPPAPVTNPTAPGGHLSPSCPGPSSSNFERVDPC
jgi:DNA-directed RNA polymerase specialized sigma24 family protein